MTHVRSWFTKIVIKKNIIWYVECLMAIVNLLKNTIFFLFCVPNNKWSFRRFSWKNIALWLYFASKKALLLLMLLKVLFGMSNYIIRTHFSNAITLQPKISIDYRNISLCVVHLLSVCSANNTLKKFDNYYN